eukprot:110148_1
MDINRDTFECLKDYSLLTLEYFDIFKQKTNVVQFLMCSQDIDVNKLTEYIQQKLGFLDFVNNEWHRTFTQQLNTMSDDPINSKLSIYAHNGSYVVPINVNHRINFYSFFTFQLNEKHHCCKEMNKFDLDKYEMTGFYLNAMEYHQRKRYVTVQYIGSTDKLQQILLKSDKATTEIIKSINTFKLGLSIAFDNKSWSVMIRMKISELLFDAVPSSDIELLDGYFGRIIPWNKPICVGHRRIYADIVDYDISQIKSDERVYRVNIYTSSQCPYPCIPISNGVPYGLLTVKYAKTFKVRQFVNKVLDQWDRNNDNEHKANDDMSYVLLPYVCYGNYAHPACIERSVGLLKIENVFVNQGDNIRSFDLFMIQTKNQDPNKLKLKIN